MIKPNIIKGEILRQINHNTNGQNPIVTVDKLIKESGQWSVYHIHDGDIEVKHCDWSNDDGSVNFEKINVGGRRKMNINVGDIVETEGGTIGVFEVVSIDNQDHSYKAHGVKDVEGYTDKNLVAKRKEYPNGNWDMQISNIKNIIKVSKNIKIGDNVIVKKKKGKKWKFNGDMPSGSTGEVIAIHNGGVDIKLLGHPEVYLFDISEIFKLDTKATPMFVLINETNPNTIVEKLPTLKRITVEAENRITNGGLTEATIYKLVPVSKISRQIKIDKIKMGGK